MLTTARSMSTSIARRELLPHLSCRDTRTRSPLIFAGVKAASSYLQRRLLSRSAVAFVMSKSFGAMKQPVATENFLFRQVSDATRVNDASTAPHVG